jgi:GT2 family glycosyltransferase
MTEAVRVDAVVVAYNSTDTLRGCVEPLAQMPDVRAVVVDNACPADSTATVADLGVTIVRAGRNGGFAAGCNVGIATGDAPYVLLLNPDARIGADDLAALVAVLDGDPAAGLAAPRILSSDGELEYSLRRFPRRRSTFAQALFLHRVWPNAAWTDELIRDHGAYERAWSPEWVSGACMLLRREALERIGGLDESYFLYCEDIDVCARLRESGWDVRYQPAATVHHEGGASRPRDELLALYAANRVRYARKHAARAAVPFEAIGVALGHLTHALTSITRPSLLRGHLRALAAVFRPQEVR